MTEHRPNGELCWCGFGHPPEERERQEFEKRAEELGANCEALRSGTGRFITRMCKEFYRLGQQDGIETERKRHEQCCDGIKPECHCVIGAFTRVTLVDRSVEDCAVHGKRQKAKPDDQCACRCGGVTSHGTAIPRSSVRCKCCDEHNCPSHYPAERR